VRERSHREQAEHIRGKLAEQLQTLELLRRRLQRTQDDSGLAEVSLAMVSLRQTMCTLQQASQEIRPTSEAS
jgi:hypothetical protein